MRCGARHENALRVEDGADGFVVRHRSGALQRLARGWVCGAAGIAVCSWTTILRTLNRLPERP